MIESGLSVCVWERESKGKGRREERIIKIGLKASGGMRVK